MSLKEKTDISPEVRRKVIGRDSIDGCPVCRYCGTPYPNGGINIHHLRSRGAGGEGHPRNLICLCPFCHARVHNGDMRIKKACEDYLNEIYWVDK